MVAALIMDADGVIINGEKFSKILARDYQVDTAKEKEFFTTGFQKCLVGEADLKESIAPYLSYFGWQGTADDLLNYWFKAEHAINKPLVTDLQKLRKEGLTIVMATNQEKYRTEYMLSQMGFDRIFDKIYSSAHLGVKKPAIQFFARVIEDLDIDKTSVLFWDDDQLNIKGALDFGINAELYTNYENFEKIMRDKYKITL